MLPLFMFIDNLRISAMRLMRMQVEGILANGEIRGDKPLCTPESTQERKFWRADDGFVEVSEAE